MTEPAHHGGLLSDRHRGWVLPLLILAVPLLFLGVSLSPSSRPESERCWANPQSCAHEAHAFPLVWPDPAQGTLTSLTLGALRFAGDDEALHHGVQVTVEGTFDAEGVLHIAWARSHPWRLHKVILGMVGLLALAVLLPLTFVLRRTPAGLRLVPRGRERGEGA